MSRFYRWSQLPPLLLYREQERLAWRCAGATLALLLGLLALGFGWAAPLRDAAGAGQADFVGLRVQDESADAAPSCAQTERRLPLPELPVVDVPMVDVPLPLFACDVSAPQQEPLEWEVNPEPEPHEAMLLPELPESLAGRGLASASRPRPSMPGAVDEDALQPARYRSTPHPPYPPDLLRRRVQGRVGLRIVVDAEGRPQAVDLSSRSGYAAFDRAAREWVREHWRFYPALRDGVAVPSVVHSSVDFVLR